MRPAYAGALAAVVVMMSAGRYYWPTSVEHLARGTVKHTHVQVKGRVTYTAKEADGDLHIRLSGLHTDTFVVAECIPKLPCPRPAKGTTITVLGISRFDAEHGWWEVHPVEAIK
jgi:hypothetical protein